MKSFNLIRDQLGKAQREANKEGQSWTAKTNMVWYSNALSQYMQLTTSYGRD